MNSIILNYLRRSASFVERVIFICIQESRVQQLGCSLILTSVMYISILKTQNLKVEYNVFKDFNLCLSEGERP